MLLKIKENYIFIQVIILKDLNCDKKLLKKQYEYFMYKW